ncbi:ALDH-like protein [Hymenopellis radicata]|nr:ALDH-like protein [Hymenopellis radicata]
MREDKRRRFDCTLNSIILRDIRRRRSRLLPDNRWPIRPCASRRCPSTLLTARSSPRSTRHTGSTLVGRKVMEAAAKFNLKDVTPEPGSKIPLIIFNDCDLEQAVSWAAHGIFWNHGQACCAGSRIFVQSGIYDEFLKRFTECTKNIKVGDPFAEGIDQGPQVSQQQYDRVMGYIQSGKEQGATIFGSVGVVIKFEDEEDVMRQANDTVYGLAAAVFSQNINCALETARPGLPGSTARTSSTRMFLSVTYRAVSDGSWARTHCTTTPKAAPVNLGHCI